jgi:menaquinone-specific isochorismate synthase
MIEQATQAIAAGEMDKVVLARATDLQFAAPLDPLASWPPAAQQSPLFSFHDGL